MFVVDVVGGVLGFWSGAPKTTRLSIAKCKWAFLTLDPPSGRAGTVETFFAREPDINQQADKRDSPQVARAPFSGHHVDDMIHECENRRAF